MRIQITKYDKFLKDYYGVNLWSIHKVLEKKTYLTGNKRSKVRKEVSWYLIKAVQLFGNFKGKETTIRIKNDECIELN